MPQKDKDKEPEFVITDRRKFTSEGDVRTQTSQTEEATTTKTVPAAQSTRGPVPGVNEEEALPEPTEAERSSQKKAYEQSGRDLDDMISNSGSPGSASDMLMSFERLVQSLYMTALLQLGVLREKEEKQVRADIIGARQTIDTLGILQEKSKGNLSGAETELLHNVLFELRMAFLEITNAITQAAKDPAPGKGTVK